MARINNTTVLRFPFELNSVYVKPSPGFQARLDSLQDPRLRYSYENHLITAARFSWLYTNQEIRQPEFWFLRANFEMSGLVMRGIAPLFNWERNEEGSYVFSGIKFSQYIKPDVDVSYHHILNKNNTLVYRVATGMGLPYGNSRALPFEKASSPAVPAASEPGARVHWVRALTMNRSTSNRAVISSSKPMSSTVPSSSNSSAPPY